MDLKSLNLCFEEAEKNDATFVAVKISMQGFPKPELIINLRENFAAKKEYYNKAYNEDGHLKTFDGIFILSAEWGKSDLIRNAVENIKFGGV